jgi:hypothetical protein
MEIRPRRPTPAKDFDVEYHGRVFQVNRILFAAHAKACSDGVLGWLSITPFPVPRPLGLAPLHSAFELFVCWLNGESVLVTRPMAVDLAALAEVLRCESLANFVAKFGDNTIKHIVADLNARPARGLDIGTHTAWLASNIGTALPQLVQDASVDALGRVLSQVGDELHAEIFESLHEWQERGLLRALGGYVRTLRVPASSIRKLPDAVRDGAGQGFGTTITELDCPEVEAFRRESTSVDEELAKVMRRLETRLGR